MFIIYCISTGFLHFLFFVRNIFLLLYSDQMKKALIGKDFEKGIPRRYDLVPISGHCQIYT